jgi:hypothetical protein
MNKAEQKKAIELMRVYTQSLENKNALMDTIKNELDAYAKNMKEAEEALLAIGEANKDAFGTDGNLDLESGYLHIAKNTVVVKTRKFDLATFMEQKSDLVKWEFKTGDIKKAFLDKDQRKELVALGVQTDVTDTIEVKVNKKKEPAMA